MRNFDFLRGLLSACAFCILSASVASAQNRAVVSCGSEDDGNVQVTLVRDANGNFAGTSAPFSLNSAHKIYFDIQGLSRVAKNSRVKVASTNLAVISASTGAWQAGAGSSLIFGTDGRAGISLFSLAGILDPEGIQCLIQLR